MRHLRNRNNIRLTLLILSLIMALSLSGCFAFATSIVSTGPSQTESVQATLSTTVSLNEEGRYTSPEDVAAYLHVYQKLPPNFMTKNEAMALGWESDQGNLWDVTEQVSIGGDLFGNREGLLPKQSGRIWYECDVNYRGGFRGPERIVYSNDGLIYYTKDHYQTFTRLY